MTNQTLKLIFFCENSYCGKEQVVAIMSFVATY